MRLKRISLFVWMMAAVIAAVGIPGETWASGTKADRAVERIDPEAARQLVGSGEALLVCAYGDDTCKTKRLEGAILASELEARLPSLSKDQKIIFYCE